jgi:hypothetical protein
MLVISEVENDEKERNDGEGKSDANGEKIRRANMMLLSCSGAALNRLNQVLS